MTEEQKNQLYDIVHKQRIFFLDDIAALMNLPKPEIRQQIKRSYWVVKFVKCPYCGREIIVVSTNRQQLFCNAEHRKLYYNKHRTKPKASICVRCGKEFFQYSFRNSKYCSIQCAALDREESKREKAQKK